MNEPTTSTVSDELNPKFKNLLQLIETKFAVDGQKAKSNWGTITSMTRYIDQESLQTIVDTCYSQLSVNAKQALLLSSMHARASMNEDTIKQWQSSINDLIRRACDDSEMWPAAIGHLLTLFTDMKTINLPNASDEDDLPTIVQHFVNSLADLKQAAFVGVAKQHSDDATQLTNDSLADLSPHISQFASTSSHQSTHPATAAGIQNLGKINPITENINEKARQFTLKHLPRIFSLREQLLNNTAQQQQMMKAKNRFDSKFNQTTLNKSPAKITLPSSRPGGLQGADQKRTNTILGAASLASIQQRQSNDANKKRCIMIEIDDTPQALKRRRKEQIEEEKKRAKQERDETRKRIEEEKIKRKQEIEDAKEARRQEKLQQAKSMPETLPNEPIATASQNTINPFDISGMAPLSPSKMTNRHTEPAQSISTMPGYMPQTPVNYAPQTQDSFVPYYLPQTVTTERPRVIRRQQQQVPQQQNVQPNVIQQPVQQPQHRTMGNYMPQSASIEQHKFNPFQQEEQQQQPVRVLQSQTISVNPTQHRIYLKHRIIPPVEKIEEAEKISMGSMFNEEMKDTLVAFLCGVTDFPDPPMSHCAPDKVRMLHSHDPFLNNGQQLYIYVELDKVQGMWRKIRTNLTPPVA